MRELVKARILKNFENGLDELNISLINYNREQNNKPQLADSLYLDKSEKLWSVEKNSDFSIVEFVNSLDDEELLIVLDSQACQGYR